eukprot:3090264-Pyramimonas_sp.AAC.1
MIAVPACLSALEALSWTMGAGAIIDKRSCPCRNSNVVNPAAPAFGPVKGWPCREERVAYAQLAPDA